MGMMPAGRASIFWQMVILGGWTVSTACLGIPGAKALPEHKQGCLTNDPRGCLRLPGNELGTMAASLPVGESANVPRF